MATSGSGLGFPVKLGSGLRAPLAAAACLGVLAVGAAFLAYSMNRPTRLAQPEASRIASRETSEIARAAQSPAAATPLATAQGSDALAVINGPAAGAPNATAIAVAEIALSSQVAAANISGFGAAPRVKPAFVGDIAHYAFTPRLKPLGETPTEETAEAIVPATEETISTVLSLATVWTADETDRPPSFFFQDDLAQNAAPPPPFAVAFDRDIAAAPRETEVTLAKGETFVDALRRAGVGAADRNAAAYAFGKVHDLRKLRPGQKFALNISETNQTLFQLIADGGASEARLLGLEFRNDAENRIALARTSDGGFSARHFNSPLTTRIAAVNGSIAGSLYLSAKRLGAPDEVIAGLAQMFAYDVDFQREIFGGDEFEAIFEVQFDESGAVIGGGDILYGRLKWRGRSKEKGYYRFAAEDGGKADYFDASGESARRLLMKTPIDGARLSSGFGSRRHPILGYAKAHKGVDFAASRGTPIMAAGDGVVERSGPYGTFGNYVRIKHSQGYKTAYAHMSAIKKGVRSGARVRQGEVIGYVGSTGRSTGPHLHYEVHLKDKAVNPQSLKIATGYELGGKELQKFRRVRDQIDAMRASQDAPATGLLADNRKKDKAL